MGCALPRRLGLAAARVQLQLQSSGGGLAILHAVMPSGKVMQIVSDAIGAAALSAVRFEGWSADECAASQFVAFESPEHVRALYREAGYGTRRGGLPELMALGVRVPVSKSQGGLGDVVEYLHGDAFPAAFELEETGVSKACEWAVVKVASVAGAAAVTREAQQGDDAAAQPAAAAAAAAAAALDVGSGPPGAMSGGGGGGSGAIGPSRGAGGNSSARGVASTAAAAGHHSHDSDHDSDHDSHHGHQCCGCFAVILQFHGKDQLGLHHRG